jgi:hypothetical protein
MTLAPITSSASESSQHIVCGALFQLLRISSARELEMWLINKAVGETSCLRRHLYDETSKQITGPCFEPVVVVSLFKQAIVCLLLIQTYTQLHNKGDRMWEIEHESLSILEKIASTSIAVV